MSSNSNKKLADKRIDDFLGKLAQRLNNSEEKVSIIGHTDNQGEADANEKLARSRAEAIKAQIVALGIDASRITASSMGETAPIATNETEAGRQENRRAEIKFQ